MTDAGPEPRRPEDPDDPEDEARRKFREALERKRAQEAGTGDGSEGKDAGKVPRTQGPARSRRSFRRRGGG
jgi:hypothetical protein